MAITISFGQNTKDWVDYFSAISPFLIGSFTLWFYFWNAKNQKEQWLNDALLKNELNVLLETKKMFSRSFASIRWYFVYVLSEYIYEEEDLIQTKDFIKQIRIHHSLLLELYNLYKENYYIFEKYNLLNELKIIHFIMHISKIIDEEKYVGVIIRKATKGNLECWEYEFSKDVQLLLESWIKENRTDLSNAKNNCKNACKEYCGDCTNNEVVLGILHNELYWLIHKLDKLTTINNTKCFNLKQEKEKMQYYFEPYGNLKGEKMNAREKREAIFFKEQINKKIKQRTKLLQGGKKGDL